MGLRLFRLASRASKHMMQCSVEAMVRHSGWCLECRVIVVKREGRKGG
jgi:hypothetical protein